MSNAAVLLTYGMTLQEWEQNGQFEREFKFLSELQHESNCQLTIIEHWKPSGDSSCYKRIAERGINRITIAPFVKPKSRVVAFLMNLFFSLLLVKHRYDLIFTNQIKGSWCLWFTRILTGQKFVARSGYSWYMFSRRRYTSKIKIGIIYAVTKITYILSSKIIVSSNEDLNECCDIFKVKEGKVMISRNWVEKANTKFNMNREGFLVVSRLVREKCVYELLEIWQGKHNLTLVGDGPELQKIQPLIKQLKVNHIKRLTNPDLLKLMTEKEFLILNSEYEGTPKVVLEALSHGLKVFLRQGPGSSELILRSNCVIGYANTAELERMLRNVNEIKFAGLNTRVNFIDKEHSLQQFIKPYKTLIEQCV